MVLYKLTCSRNFWENRFYDFNDYVEKLLQIDVGNNRVINICKTPQILMYVSKTN